MLKPKKLTILIPCLNEERSIGKVITSVPREVLGQLGFTTEIIVINNNSTDRTGQVAKVFNAKVIFVEKKGKGNALKAGFYAISADTDYVVMLDGDNTYKPNEIVRMLEPLINDFCDVIIGSRLGGKIKKNSFSSKNRLANWGYTFLVRHFYTANITDVLSGYFAWKIEVLDRLIPHLESEGFAIEMEMITKMSKLGYSMYSVPITYDKRVGESKIQAFKDGVSILSVFFKNLFWSPDCKDDCPSLAKRNYPVEIEQI